jgi:hypothetical protein
MIFSFTSSFLLTLFSFTYLFNSFSLPMEMVERDHFFNVQQNRVTCKPEDFCLGPMGFGGLNLFS